MTPNVTGTRRAFVDKDCCCTLFGVANTVARYSDRVDKMIDESISVAYIAAVEMAVEGEFVVSNCVIGDTCL